MSIFLSATLIIVAVLLFSVKLNSNFAKLQNVVGGIALFLAGFSAISGGISYNDAGFCVHIRTIFGSESSKCNLGWYFSGWGRATEYPHFITITHTSDKDAEGSSISPPYQVRMADNWSGHVTQTTRYGIPQDEEQFLRMAHDFRSPERLITSTLRPAITASLDSVANLYTMEEYYAGGRRDDFKTEYLEAVTKGRAVIERVEIVQKGPDINHSTAPSNDTVAADTADTGGSSQLKVATRKKLDASGSEIRIKHGYSSYGITVSTAILMNLDPDDLFEDQIKERKDAAARRSVAREKRLEQEEQRLLALAEAEREIATKQGQSRVLQIQRTTDADTDKRLALIAAEKRKGEAKVAKETAQLNLERAEIDAKAKRVTAEAEAYEKQALLEADGALAQKLGAWIQSQKAWANAFASRKVPTTVMGASGGTGPGSDGDAKAFMDILTMQAAKQLQLDITVQGSGSGPSSGSGSATPSK